MISIIIPTYNERENIGRLIERIFRISKKNRLNIEIIVVDDNSEDGTSEVVSLLSKKYRVKLLKRPKKMGLSSAVLDGLKIAKGNIIGVMDADFTHPPEKIPEFVKAMKNNDIVIGSRYIEGGKVEGRSILRSIISWGATLIAKIFLNIKVKDPIAGFFFCKRKIIERTKIEAKGFKILLNILVKNKGKKVKEIPILSIERRRGKSKLGFQEIIYFLITVIKLKFSN
jgi:dolichol-phosphate mannosyltransferase